LATPAGGAFDMTLKAGQSSTANRFGVRAADPDDSIAEVNQRPGNQVKVGGSVHFTISNFSDVDLVQFTVKSDQRIGFDVDRAAGSSLNSYLRLFNSAGRELAANDNAAAPGETANGADSYLAFTFAAAGTYYVSVSASPNKSYSPLTGAGDSAGGTTGAYKLTLTALAPTRRAAGAPALIAAPAGWDPLSAGAIVDEGQP
jgi:hypothetical protein